MSFQKMAYLKIGKIISTRGLKGEVKVYPTTDFIAKRYKRGNKVFLDDESKSELVINSYSLVGNIIFLTFEGFDSIESIQGFINKDILILKDRKDLPKGSYFHDDLIGLTALDEGGNKLGEVIAVEEYPAQKSLRIKKIDGTTSLVPFIDAFIAGVDLENKSLTIKVIDGLI